MEKVLLPTAGREAARLAPPPTPRAGARFPLSLLAAFVAKRGHRGLSPTRRTLRGDDLPIFVGEGTKIYFPCLRPLAVEASSRSMGVSPVPRR